MYEYLIGKIIEKNPSFLVIEVNHIGYLVQISLNSYSALVENEIRKVFIHQIIREDTNQFFGLCTKEEREIFRFLITVSGIGANTARMMLSSLSPAEIQKAISTENVNVLKGVKGIGIKTAQRLIIELKDKMLKMDAPSVAHPLDKQSEIKDEALAALVMLGFVRNQAEKAIDRLISESGEIKAEELVKKALKLL